MRKGPEWNTPGGCLEMVLIGFFLVWVLRACTS